VEPQKGIGRFFTTEMGVFQRNYRLRRFDGGGSGSICVNLRNLWMKWASGPAGFSSGPEA